MNTNATVFLKIKAKSLAAESRIIRKEFHKVKNHYSVEREYILNSLNSHKRVVVRNEARATYLAIAFIRGKKYSKTEHSNTDKEFLKNYILKKTLKMIQKYYSYKVTIEDLESWVKI